MNSTEKNEIIKQWMAEQGDVSAKTWNHPYPPPYHSAWEWLMSVVEKIESMKGEDGRGEVNYIVTIEDKYCVISLGGEGQLVERQRDDSKIQTVFDAVYLFIKVFTVCKEPLTESKPGHELIAAERMEQIEKQGRSVQYDLNVNGRGQLIDAAMQLIRPDLDATDCKTPRGWDTHVFNRMFSKNRTGRLIIAGALIAAEIDRQQGLHWEP